LRHFSAPATQISLHRSFSRSAWNTPHSYTVRKIRWRRLLSARYISSSSSAGMIPSTGTCSPGA
jgi:hypothetical protein